MLGSILGEGTPGEGSGGTAGGGIGGVLGSLLGGSGGGTGGNPLDQILAKMRGR